MYAGFPDIKILEVYWNGHCSICNWFNPQLLHKLFTSPTFRVSARIYDFECFVLLNLPGNNLANVSLPVGSRVHQCAYLSPR